MRNKIFDNLRNITSQDVFVIDSDTISDGQGREDTSSDIDLLVSKTDSPEFIKFGDDLTYTINIINRGPGNATGVILTDILPLGVDFKDASLSKGKYTEEDKVITCNIEEIKKGEEVTVMITVNPTSTGTLCNRIFVSANERDLDVFNNEIVDCTTVLRTFCIEANKVLDSCRDQITHNIELSLPCYIVNADISSEVTSVNWDVISVTKKETKDYVEAVIRFWVYVKSIVKEGAHEQVIKKSIGINKTVEIYKPDVAEIICDITESDCQLIETDKEIFCDSVRLILTMKYLVKSIQNAQIEIPYIKLCNSRPN